MLTEENKFFARLLSPNLHELQEQFRKFGLSPDDFVTILHRRMKGKVTKPNIRLTLDVLYKLQRDVSIAAEIERRKRED